MSPDSQPATSPICHLKSVAHRVYHEVNSSICRRLFILFCPVVSFAAVLKCFFSVSIFKSWTVTLLTCVSRKSVWLLAFAIDFSRSHLLFNALLLPSLLISFLSVRVGINHVNTPGVLWPSLWWRVFCQVSTFTQISPHIKWDSLKFTYK